MDKNKLTRVYNELGISNIISHLPKGDETILEHNCKLTASEKIRISLAIVSYYDPDIVILDQPFASLDQETSSIIYDHIRKYMKDKTVILATQMSGFIRTDDKVLLLRQGIAVEYGPFSAMLKSGKRSYLNSMISLNKQFQIEQALAIKQEE